MKKYTMAILFVLFLMLSMYSVACAAPGDAILFPPGEDGSFDNCAQSIASVGDTLYLLTYKGLYAWQAKDSEPRLVSGSVKMRYASIRWEDMSTEEQETNKNSVNYLLEMEGKLYGLNTVKGVLHLLSITDDGVNISDIAVLDWDKMIEQQGQIINAVLTGNILYLLVQQPIGGLNDYALLAFDLSTGAQNKIAVKNVHAITRYENGQLLCNIYNSENIYTSDGKLILPTLSVLDTTTQKLTKLTDFPTPRVGGLCYSSESGMVYAMGVGELYACKPGNTFKTVTYLPIDNPSDQMPGVILSDGLYAAIPNYDTVYVRNTNPSLRANRVLRIAGGFPDNVSQQFQAVHPDLPVIFVDAPYLGSEQIAQQMVSGSDSADLYIISLSYGGFTFLRDKGYVTDLSGSTILIETVSKMYPQFVKDFFVDGKLIAFPYRFNASILGYSPDILKELGVERPPQTPIKLIDLYVDWVDKYAQDFASYSLQDNVSDIRMELLSTIMVTYIAHYAYIGEELKFDTPLFKAMLKKLNDVSPVLKELNPSDKEWQYGIVNNNDPDNKPTSLISTDYTFYPMEYTEDWRYLPLPLSLEEGMDPVLFAYIDVFVINPNSPNQDLAQNYLEYFAQNMPRDISITFCPDDNMPVERPEYTREIVGLKRSVDELKKEVETADPEEIKSLENLLKMQEDALAWNEKNRFSISDRMIKQYRGMVPYIYIDTHNVNFLTSSQEAQTLLQRFTQGELRIDQFVRELDRKLQMMRLESN